MPSLQQKSAKKGSKRYLMFGPNHILITLRWDNGRSPGHKNFCYLFIYFYFIFIYSRIQKKMKIDIQYRKKKVKPYLTDLVRAN